MLGKKLIQAASGSGAAGGGLGVEDVFSTWLYTGNGSTQTITNGIDLSGEGGLVWIKKRDAADNNEVFDTARGAGYRIRTDSTAAQAGPSATYLSAFNSDGFSLGNDGGVNSSGNIFASWTFRKAPGFFDVVTYTGTGSPQNIAHSLGSVPGCVIVKSISSSINWFVYHRSIGETKGLILNLTDAQVTSSALWNDTAPTADVFTVGSASGTNLNGDTFVAYLFAHDEQIFGEGGDQSVIKCGSYTGTSVNNNYTELGWEPQWVLIKNATTGATYWSIFDSQRGIFTGGQDPFLKPNASDAESTNQSIDVWPTGFSVFGTSSNFNASGNTYIYIAIRRGPMKTPTDATKVFAGTVNSGTGSWPSGFTDDLIFSKQRSDSLYSFYWYDRVRGQRQLLRSALTDAEITSTNWYFDTNDGVVSGGAFGASITYHFRRAPGFFDVVAYTGTGVARTVPHNLGVAPELMIVKTRNDTNNWAVYSKTLPITSFLKLNGNDAAISYSLFNGVSPTSLVFSVGIDLSASASSNYIAYLFATCPGVSKVGSYTGTGTTLNVDCGFTAGARFVLIKRTDSTGDWYVWDTARGIVSGSDPYLLLNSTAAEVTSTDYIDPLSSGFQISSTAPAAINASGGSYIFLAIA